MLLVVILLTGCKQKGLSETAIDFAHEQIECLRTSDNVGFQKSIQETKEWLGTLDKTDREVAIRIINDEVMASGAYRPTPAPVTPPSPNTSNMDNPYKCEFCGGRGQDFAGEICQICGGKGWAKMSAGGEESSSGDNNGGNASCPHCHGSGKCEGCHGTGTISKDYGVGRIACPVCPGKINGKGNGICKYCGGR